jgi:MFS family permease
MATRNPRKNVLLLSFVSLFNDMSSKMVYPLVPVFLESLGASKAIIGAIEGIAEATASVFRPLFGKLSDVTKRRKLFVFGGYGLSAIPKPLLFFAHAWPVVLVLRFFDRAGKAVRSPAKDALLSSSAEKSQKGRAFGLNRAMDKFGAIIAPLLAFIVLKAYDENVRYVFLYAAIPAIIAVAIIPFTVETTLPPKEKGGRAPLSHNRAFLAFTAANVVFALGNSSNVFLILKARECGLSIAMVPFIWLVYGLFASAFSYPLGRLSDVLGRKPIIIVSFLLYSLVYFLFGLSRDLAIVWALFGAYGLYYALSDGIYKAHIADIVEPDRLATAYGIYSMAVGVSLLPASVVFGIIWDKFGGDWAFYWSASLSLIALIVFLLTAGSPQRQVIAD